MNSKKNLKRNLLICLLAGSAVMYTLPLHAATSVIGNNTLPQNGQFVGDSAAGSIVPKGDLQLDVSQKYQNAVIKWDSFDVGGSATVNFSAEGAYANNFNTLNYINSGAASQIYGTINAQGGNIFIVNPAGVQIGNSAQINVGSLYVSNKNLDDAINKLFKDVENDGNIYQNINLPELMNNGTTTEAVLMNLGNINASKVTFEGDGRIVIDSERLKDEAGNDKLGYQNINITTSADNTDNIIIGYDAYDETNGYKIADTDTAIATVNGSDFITKANGYMWVEDVEQLQAINTNLSGNYALRNSIDATSTEQQGNEFSSIGITSAGNVDNNEEGFTGKFDGLDYSIFDLNIDETGNDNVGLFGYTTDATISNVTLVGGSIRGNNNVGAVVGNANNTTVTNALNSAAVSGNSNVGGIVGSATNTTVEDAINTGAIEGRENTNGGSNVGGLIGSMNSSHLIGNSYNLGDVTSIGSNVGGLVGSASNSTIGNPSVVNGKPVENVETVYNRMDVTGAYNVGGIVGNMEGSTVQNAENSGTVTAERYTTEKYNYHTANGGTHIESVDVNVANVGGIAGKSSNKSTIENVTNTANVSSKTNNYEQYGSQHEYYTAGNAGGIVGRAEDTDITNATNQENEIRGAHNVGGVAGYFGGTGTVSGGINDGGDIMATGARYNDNFVRELIRPVGDSNESFIIGNIGGVVGYMDGDNVYVTESANRGTVHSQDIEEENATNVLYTSQAANVGGVVGKIDRSDTKGLDEIKNNTSLAAVNNSYNTGDVRGYTGVGGVAGMMYNGEIAASYNLGYLRTTRQSQQGGSIDALNMGGIVGDTTELSGAEVYLYDVYNKGQIGDSEFNYFGRHVGGIVGRLSGTVEKAYNNGAIYNGYNVVGGIAGWMAKGKIENAFNTGNITVLNKNDAQSQVGGIAGAASDNSDIVINNAYNLGTLRSFKDPNVANAGNNTLGGILGHIQNEKQGDASVTITNVYTTGNLFVDDGNGIGSIYGSNTIGDRLNVSNAYYISPQEGLGFKDLSGTNRDNSNKPIDFNDKDNKDNYQFEGGITEPSKTSGDVDEYNSAWRIYGGNTPILNVFLPKAEDYFSGESGNSNAMNGIDSIQYGTAYDPLLTIIKADDEYLTANNLTALTYNWSDLGISNAAGLVVYGAGLTLDNVNTSGGSGYFGGTIYADGALNLNGGKNDIGLGSAADIYGSAVNITTDGKVTIYGDLTATGNRDNGTTEEIDTSLDVDGAGNITISASDVDVYGTLTSASNNQDANVKIPGIEDSAVTWTPGVINNPYASMADIADRFAHTTGDSAVDGNITITANGTWNDADNDNIKDEGEVTGGNVNLYFGNKEQGLITTGGNLTVTGTGDVYVDSDLSIGGGLSLTAGADKEIVLDISNIGQVQNNHNSTDAVETLHKFLGQFDEDNAIKFNGTDDAKITVDMWQGDAFDLDKFDIDNNKFAGALTDLKVKVNDADTSSGRDITHIWVSSGEQLKNIQTYYNEHINDTGILGYNFALKNDINASDVSGYEAIGTNSANGFTGTFDGRGNRIIGLKVENANGNAGIFDTIGTNGVVKDVNIYSGTFTGSENAGAVAGVNSGRIEGIVTFGNTVTVTGNGGNAGGIAGTNSGTVDDVESSGSVIAEDDNAFVGGLVGTNESGATVNNSYSNSAVTSTSGTDAGLGGVVGVNKGTVSLVDSLGVTNGTNSTKVGGVIGINSGTLSSAYNESIVNGYSNVGGIIGDNANTGTVSNIVNATGVTGTGDYVGGLVGTNIGSVENGRNNGTITGTNYVGGMVGSNAANATLTNLVNDSSAAIEGEQYVGGIAGSNSGTITADEKNDNLINRGSITGNKYVGGVAGENKDGGTIANTLNSVVLHAKGDNAQYFGGVVGQNSGLINGATNTSDINITAVGGTYVGGIIGNNTGSGTLKGEILNQGSVAGKSNVGGIIGLNENASVLQGTAGNRLTVTNEGNVTAEDGGAAGIFYANTGNISYADITNTGTVTGGSETDSVTGGLFGTNSGEITNSTLTNTGIVTGGTVGGLIGNNSGSAANSTFTNSGTVSGNTNVGGLFGTNSGDFSTSSLINTVDAQVIGIENVGGLIGTNTGKIEGGRDANNSYYKYQIYNNGVINVGTWDDTNNNGKVDAGEITGLQQGETSQNIGGLIGNNTTENGKTGSLTAGYNTGAINAGSSTNVGGIAGSNAGTIGEVFNTVYNTDGNKGVITGGTNVGGLVGENTNNGTLSNAYNTTEVVGKLDNAIVGNAVGVNNDNATVSNVYDVTNTNNKLIGENSNGAIVDNSYTSAKQEESADGITYIYADEAKDKESYKNFADGTWKFYDGYSNPLLSVFLTKVKVNQDKVNEYMNEHKVYNGSMQELTAADIKNLIESGAIYVNGLTKEEAFEAFNNNNSLISSIGYKDVGEHSNWLYSGQIASGSQDATFNPNNLGYDIELTASIAQAELSISDILANIVYGGNTYTDIAGGSLTGIINNDDVYLRDKNGNKISITSDLIAAYLSGDYAANKDNRNTADVKRDQNNNIVAYEDAISVDGISLGGTASGNYKLTDTTISGDITVTPATLNITLNDIYRIYGDYKTKYSNYDATQTGDYGIKDVIGLVNGDQDNLNELIVTAISDGALDDYANPTKTNDVTKDGYKWTGEFSGIDNVNSNYTITVGGGNSIVKAKTITIKDLLASIVYGNQDNKGLQINTGASLADGSIVYGDDVRLVTDNAQYTTGGAYEDSRGNRTTADVGEYTDSLFVSGLSLTGDKAGNYVLDKTAAVGDIEVTKANLIINVGNAETVYGDAFNDNDYTHTLNGVTNGDSDTVIDGLLGGNYDNTVAVETGKDTANAGTYKDALGFVNYQQLKNYDVQVENGDVIINKKQITIGVNDEQILVGETPNYSGTDIQEQLVNGDIISDDIYHYGVSADTDVNVAGEHNIGIYINGTYYELQNPDWSSENGLGFFANYNVTFEPGTLTVSAYDIPEDWPHNRWDYLFNDAPFDRNKDFRERKAEVNFVDGGMEI